MLTCPFLVKLCKKEKNTCEGTTVGKGYREHNRQTKQRKRAVNMTALPCPHDDGGQSLPFVRRTITDGEFYRH